MVASMTAFARKQGEYPWGTLSWEIRSVNHRYLEPAIRTPEMLRPLEPGVREALRRQVSRGKVDCQLRFQASDAQSREMSLDRQLLARIETLGREVRAASKKAAPLSVADFLQWPGMLQEPEPDVESIGEQAMILLAETLADFNASRLREGAGLAAAIERRLDSIGDIVSDVRGRMPEILERQRQTITERLEQLREELDPQRLEQEIVLAAQKSDIDEELDRLETHVTEVRRVLTLSEPIGRRLDFLLQELNREANTLSSKSIVSETTLSAVELKVLIEQIREQVQNIE